MLAQRSSITAALAALAAASLATGCGKSSGAGNVNAEATLASLRVEPAQGASVPVGGTVQFTATGVYSDDSTQDLTAAVTWASSSPETAAVSNDAATAGLASTLAIGTAQISATLDGLTAGAALEVLQVVSLDDISPAGPTLLAGTTLQLTAWGTLADGSSVDLTGAVTWSSDDESVATVSATGLVAGVAARLEAVTITATHVATGQTVSTQVWVTDEPHVLSYVAFDRGSVPGGDALTGTVALTSPAEVDTIVTLSNGNPELVTVPLEVVVLAGEALATFDVTTATTSTNMTHVTVVASDGLYDKAAKLNVRRTR